ncbi:MAG TPA: proteasome accessory factor PafA2 family protein [Candidatus Saccharimonadales bacterium]|nr:proteasome accessory factor PafA2 family protein [Candidatus Saccharimonadales bacterium]
MPRDNGTFLVTPDGAPQERIVGFETEYALQWKAGPIKPKYEVINMLGSAFSKADSSFLPTGERVYVDVGTHPEYCTAEETIFLDAAYRVLRGHVYMAERLKAVNQQDKLLKTGSPILIANTCDTAGSSWSSHENYLVRRGLEIGRFAPALIVHNATRIVWSGAGTVQDTEDGSFQFGLSEKADFMIDTISPDTTRIRGLVNTRDEPHADPNRYRRIHNISGETVFSPFAQALRMASASILLRACELGVNFNDLALAYPVEAMQEISADPSLKHRVELKNGQRMTAVDVQKKLAERSIYAAQAAGYLTPQEEAWAGGWIEVLDDLSRDPQSCDTRVDWVIKQGFIEEVLDSNDKRHGDKKKPARDVAWKAAAYYHTLAPKEGKGMQLIRSGHYDLSPTADVLDKGLPLPETRAKIRGQAIKKARKSSYEISCDWSVFGIKDYGLSRSVTLSDPYATQNDRVDALFEPRPMITAPAS